MERFELEISAGWRHYGEKKLAPLRRKNTGSIATKTDTTRQCHAPPGVRVISLDRRAHAAFAVFFAIPHEVALPAVRLHDPPTYQRNAGLLSNLKTFQIRMIFSFSRISSANALWRLLQCIEHRPPPLTPPPPCWRQTLSARRDSHADCTQPGCPRSAEPTPRGYARAPTVAQAT